MNRVLISKQQLGLRYGIPARRRHEVHCTPDFPERVPEYERATSSAANRVTERNAVSAKKLTIKAPTLKKYNGLRCRWCRAAQRG